MVKMKFVMVCFMAFILAACASQPLPAPNWTFQKDAISIHLKADAKLNVDDGVPHTLLVCIYQLKDPNAFNQLSEDTDGIYKLLECSLFDAAVATAKRTIVNPGQDIKIVLDRAEEAKYVAVVAGYYVLQKDRMIRLYDIPVEVKTKGFIKRSKSQVPSNLDIELQLGPSQITG